MLNISCEDIPLICLNVILQVNKLLPIFVNFRSVCPEVITWPACFLAEENGTDMGFCLPHSLNVLPASHQFMKVCCSKFCRIFLKIIQKTHSFFEEEFICLEL